MDQVDDDKYSALACLKETQGERVMRALKKIYDKMQTLEQARNRRKERVESLQGQIDHPLADEFCRRFAKAEAQCKLLEEQLSYIRKMVAQTHSDPRQETGAVVESKDFLTFDFEEFPTKLPKEHKDSTPPQKYYPQPSESAITGTVGGFLTKEYVPKPTDHYVTSTSPNNHKEKHATFFHPQSSKLRGFEKPLKGMVEQRPMQSHQHQRHQVSQMSFVPAATSSKSHSLRANMQIFHSMVKYCNPVLCSAAPLHRKRSLSGDRQSRVPEGSEQRQQYPRRKRSNSMSDLLALTKCDYEGVESQNHVLCRGSSRSNERLIETCINFEQRRNSPEFGQKTQTSFQSRKPISKTQQKKLLLRNLQQINNILKQT